MTEAIAAALEEARAATHALLAPLDDAVLAGQHSPLMSPLVWDLAHVGNYEDQWLLRAVGASGVGARYDELYDAFAHPRRTRASLPLLDPPATRRYVTEVRARVLDHLASAAVDAPDPLPADGFVYGMVAQHEHQHDETMLAALQLLDAPHPEYIARRFDALCTRGRGDDEVLVPAGEFVMGTDTEPWAYDNERPAHVVDLPAYFIDTAPVTNGDYLAFVEDGGYHEPRWWAAAGWSWRLEAALEHPQFWRREGPGAWSVERFGLRLPLPLDEPVQHVCWYEADAYARWRGKRLPTEAEWEKAASWHPATGTKRRHPWGDDPPDARRANLGRLRWGPAPVGCLPDGASAVGCLAMLGDVWEWTATDFAGYPGFRSFPYAEYSEVFFGNEYKVLRGGSWATHPLAARTTFRNWDFPVRRQIFAGFRCARDA